MTQYYVSADASGVGTGLSPSLPWSFSQLQSASLSSGDLVTFRTGDTFSGTLNPQNGVSHDIYGTGTTATIDGGDSSALSATNVTFSLNRLTFQSTNAAASCLFLNITTTAGTRYVGPTIQNCTIIGGQVALFFQAAHGSSDGYDEISISNNQIYNSTQFGILFSEDVSPPQNNNHFVSPYIGENEVYNITGDSSGRGATGTGITILCCNGGLIEYNYVHDCAASSTDGLAGPGGIYPAYSDGITIQWNEVHHIHAPMNADGIGIDLDVNASNCIVQYNYVHECDGAGFVSFSAGTGNVYRFNLAVNNCLKGISADGSFLLQGGGIVVYNNTIVQTGFNQEAAVRVTGGTVEIYNNVLIGPYGTDLISGGPTAVAGNFYRAGNGFQATISGTTYTTLAAFRAAGFETAGGSSGVVGNQSFVSPTVIPVTDGPDNISSISEFTPTSVSVLLGAGLDLHTLYGIDPGATDLSGNSLPSSGYAIGCFNNVGTPTANAYDLLVLNQYPEAYYPTQETTGTTANELTGNIGVNGVYHSVTLGQSGTPGTFAAQLAGSSSSYMDTGTTNILANTKGLTVDIWISPSDATDVYMLGQVESGGGGTFSTSFQGNSHPGELGFWVRGGGNFLFVITSGANIQLNSTPVMATFVWSGTNQTQLYINGVQVNTTVSSNQSITTVGSSSANTRMGIDGGGNNPYAGKYERAAMYTYPSTGAEVAARFAAAAPGPSVAPSSSSNPVTGTTATLSPNVTGAGTSPAYSWTCTAKPSGANPSFSGSLASPLVTFNKSGSYTFALAYSDSGGSASGSVDVTVSQTLSSIVVHPSPATVLINATQTFAAVALDQFGLTMTATIAWTAPTGTGTINGSTGVYTAPAAAETGSVRATSGSVHEDATVRVVTKLQNDNPESSLLLLLLSH